MKAFEGKLIVVTICILVVAVHQSLTLEVDYAEDDLDVFELSTLRSFKSLTPEEEALANEARAHIAKTIEKNLIRLLAIASTQSERQARQDEDDDDSVTPNPNVLPQVAQILGAIFSGSLNITRVVDQTFGLVPNIVRNQVGGLVKLLTGENMNGTVATASASIDSQTKEVTDAPAPAPSPAPVVVTTPIETTSTSNPKVRIASTSTPPELTTSAAVVSVENKTTSTILPLSVPELEEITQNLIRQQGNNTSRNRYKIRNRNRLSSTTHSSILEDDEIEKLEEDLKHVGKAYEPYMRDRDPRFIAEAFRRVFGRVDMNSTQITSAVPTLFKGARQALVVLDNLGILDANDLLDELGLPTIEVLEE